MEPSSPQSRGEPLSVWAFEEVFASSLPLPLTDTLSIRVPTVEGYAAAKLGAWLDRSKWHEAKDAADLALIMYWYAESTVVHDRLYDTPAGNEILVEEDADLSLAAVHLLGTDVIATIGPRRKDELLNRGPATPTYSYANSDCTARRTGSLRRGAARPSLRL